MHPVDRIQTIFAPREDRRPERSVQLSGDVGYLLLSFAIPLSGTHGPMGELCDAIAHSLRWM